MAVRAGRTRPLASDNPSRIRNRAWKINFLKSLFLPDPLNLPRFAQSPRLVSGPGNPLPKNPIQRAADDVSEVYELDDAKRHMENAQDHVNSFAAARESAARRAAELR